MLMTQKKIASVSVAVLVATMTLHAQEMRTEGPVETRATIAVESKNAPALDPGLLHIEVNGHDAPLTALSRVSPATTQVAILIDDGLRTSFDLQIRDLKDFINGLPAGTQVFIGYMRNGGVFGGTGFMTDHAAVANAIRVPIAAPGVSASPYFCLSEFVKHWPSQEPATRVVMMLTNGVDPYNGSTSVLNQDSPYVQTAAEDAQRAGVAVYSVAYGDAGVRGGSAAFSGQSYLQQVADATGGRSLYQGSIELVSLKPFLDEFGRDLRESYTARFMASSNHEKPNTLVRFKAKSTQPNVKLLAPDAVHPGQAQ